MNKIFMNIRKYLKVLVVQNIQISIFFRIKPNQNIIYKVYLNPNIIYKYKANYKYKK